MRLRPHLALVPFVVAPLLACGAPKPAANGGDAPKPAASDKSGASGKAVDSQSPPEAIAAAFVDAIRTTDTAAIERLQIDAIGARALLDCPDGTDPLKVLRAGDVFATASTQLMGYGALGAKVDVGPATRRPDRDRPWKSGQEVSTCRARVSAEAQAYVATWSAKGGGVDEGKEFHFALVHVAEGWWVIPE